MTLWHRLTSVVRWMFRRDEAEQRLDDELRSFVDLSAAEKMRDGMAPAEARRLAMIELGGNEQVKERVRRYRHGGLLDEIGRDVRYAFRMFAKTPGFTLVVVLTLALGIGANTAVFTLIDALMLRSLPVHRPGELVQLRMGDPGSTEPGGESFSNAIVRGLAEQRDVFAGVAGYSGGGFDVGPSGAVSPVRGAWVTGGFYGTLGLIPEAGRLLTAQDDERDAPLVAVISYGYWVRQLGRNPGAVGQILQVNGQPVTIVGISPRGFVGANVGAIADLTMPTAALARLEPQAAGLLEPGNFWLRVLARPRPDVTAAEAAARLNTVWPQLADQVIAKHWSASRRQEMKSLVFQQSPGGTGWTYLRDIYRTPLFILMAVVGLVLIIACANVASLLLARASSRQREIAVRLAIGASRGRIIRQLLIESTLLSLIGAALGTQLAWFCGYVFVSILSAQDSGIVFDLSPNWRILAFTCVVATATGILFGAAPALQTSSAEPVAALKKNEMIARTRSRLLPSLISVQVALSLVLVAGAGLFLRTLQNLQSLDPGFSAEGVLLVDLDEHPGALPPALLDDVRRLPGVVAASLASHTPLNGGYWSDAAVPAGQPLPEKDNAIFIGASPGFFPTLQIQIVSGREFSEGDTAGSPAVAVVNETFAQRHFPDRNPVGERLAASVNGDKRDLEIVGVARNTSIAGLRQAPPSTVYVPYAQLNRNRAGSLAVRASGALGQAVSSLQQTLQARIPNMSIEVRPLSTQVAATLVRERLMATLAGGFGVLALALSCIGLYGLLAYTVAQRTREIGIRMALGAQSKRVVGLVIGRATKLVVVGLALGLPATWAGTQWIESMLFGLTPTDPMVLLGSIVLLAASAQLAAFLPARRASRVDPLVALRHE